MSEEAPAPDEYEDNPRIRSLVEGGGFSYGLARQIVHGTDGVQELAEGQSAAPAQEVVYRSPRRPRHSRRGGRAFPESDRDVEVVPPYEPESAEELARRQERTRDGIKLARRALAAAQLAEDMKIASELGVSVQAVTYGRLDRDARERKERPQ